VSCILLHEPPAGDQYPIYCRAIITKVDGDNCDLWLVDYAETKKAQPVRNLFEVPAQFAELAWQAVKCKLHDASGFVLQFNDEAKKKAFVDGFILKKVVATIKAIDNEGFAVVEVRFGDDKRDLREVCKDIANGVLHAF